MLHKVYSITAFHRKNSHPPLKKTLLSSILFLSELCRENEVYPNCVNEPYVTGGNPIMANDDVMLNDMLGRMNNGGDIIMFVQKILKCIFVFSAITGLLLILRRNGVLQCCGIGIYMLAPSAFYPAFYGNKWDYLRIAGFSLTAVIAAAGLMFVSARINPISGMEGLEIFVLRFEIFIFAIILVLITTAFCCRMKKFLKTAIPGIVFGIYILTGFYITLTVKTNIPKFYFQVLGITPLLLLLPLNIIMAIRILLGKKRRDEVATVLPQDCPSHKL